MFLHVSLCPQEGESTWAGTHPRQVHPQTRYTPSRYPPDRYTPSDQVHPRDQVHPLAGTPWAGTPTRTRCTPRARYIPLGSSGCWEIRATSGRYASYWNAFLFNLISLHWQPLMSISYLNWQLPSHFVGITVQNETISTGDTAISLHTPVPFRVLQETFQFGKQGFLVSLELKFLSPPGKVSILGGEGRGEGWNSRLNKNGAFCGIFTFGFYSS